MNLTAESLITMALGVGLIALVGLVGRNIIQAMKSLMDHQIAMGTLVNNQVKHQLLKDDYFDTQARDLQR